MGRPVSVRIGRFGNLGSRGAEHFDCLVTIDRRAGLQDGDAPAGALEPVSDQGPGNAGADHDHVSLDGHDGFSAHFGKPIFVDDGTANPSDPQARASR